MSLANVQLERGESATEFISEEYDETLSKCQRFYETGTIKQTALVTGNDREYAFVENVHFVETKRETPTVTTTRVSASGTSSPTFGAETTNRAYITDRGFLCTTQINNTGKAAGVATLEYNWVADSELPVGWNNQIPPSHFEDGQVRQDGQ